MAQDLSLAPTSKPLAGSSQRLSIIIPVFNEASTVLQLLDAVFRQPLPENLQKEIVIIESRSTDGTRELVENWVSAHSNAKTKEASSFAQIQLILEDRPGGKGQAVRKGLQAARGDIILIQDADLEYDTGDYPLLLEPILKGHVDFVLGSRHLSAGSWKIRKFEESKLKSFVLNLGGVFFHGLFNLLYGTELTDPTTMFKVFRRKCIEGLYFEASRFDFDFELLGKIIRNGYLPLEVPVSYQSRGFDEGKKVRLVGDPLLWIRAIVKYRFSRLR